MKKTIIAAVVAGTTLLSGCSGASKGNSSLSSINSNNGNANAAQNNSTSSSTSTTHITSTVQENSSISSTSSASQEEISPEQYKKENFIVGATKYNDWYYKETSGGNIEAVMYVGDYSEIDDVDEFISKFYGGLYGIIVEAPNRGIYTYWAFKEDGNYVATTFNMFDVRMPIIWAGDYAPLNENTNAQIFSALWSDVSLDPTTSEPSSSGQPENSTSSTQNDTTTTGERNALKKAQSYLGFSAFSRDGLIGQLEYEGFTKSEAVYGVDNVGANWNEQAVKKAKNYLSFTSFSYSGLVEQLEFEEFTHEQAVYGADKCGADWNEQAVKKAKSYLDFMPFSREGLIEQLEFEGFTHNQAVYGVTQNGY